MPSFTTVNKIDENSFICKYNVFETREEAEARIAELHQTPGYEAAFLVDNDATAVNGQMCFQTPSYWPVDKINKTVSFDQAAYDRDKRNSDAEAVQNNRRAAYQAEADTLYFEEQADEVAAGTWAAKRAEIKSRFPK
jgi:hypothetical protein